MDETALAFDRACRAAGVSYTFVGAFAVMAWGEPRATTDVDVLVAYREPQIAAWTSKLRAEGLSVDARALEDSLRDGSHATIAHEDSVFWVEVKPARTADEQRQVEAAFEVEIRGQRLRVARPEDTVAYKLHFGSPKDVQDAFSILVRQAGRLDEARLAQFALRLGVAEALATLRARAERGP